MYNQEQTVPTTSMQLVDLLSTLSLSASTASPASSTAVFAENASGHPATTRRVFRRQSSGPLTEATDTEIAVGPTGHWESHPPSTATAAGQRAAELFGVGRTNALPGGRSGLTHHQSFGPTSGSPAAAGAVGSSPGHLSHWAGRSAGDGGSPMHISPTKPLARPRTFQRLATANGGQGRRVLFPTSPSAAVQMMDGSSISSSHHNELSSSTPLVCPGTPDPRRRLVRHHTAPDGNRSSTCAATSNSACTPRRHLFPPSRQLAGTKRSSCTTPPSQSATRVRPLNSMHPSSSTSPRALTARHTFPRAPEKRRSSSNIFLSASRPLTSESAFCLSRLRRAGRFSLPRYKRVTVGDLFDPLGSSSLGCPEDGDDESDSNDELNRDDDDRFLVRGAGGVRKRFRRALTTDFYGFSDQMSSLMNHNGSHQNSTAQSERHEERTAAHSWELQMDTPLRRGLTRCVSPQLLSPQGEPTEPFISHSALSSPPRPAKRVQQGKWLTADDVSSSFASLSLNANSWQVPPQQPHREEGSQTQPQEQVASLVPEPYQTTVKRPHPFSCPFPTPTSNAAFKTLNFGPNAEDEHLLLHYPASPTPLLRPHTPSPPSTNYFPVAAESCHDNLNASIGSAGMAPGSPCAKFGEAVKVGMLGV
ncbi:hypothetical protein DFS34DRAFT_619918 [Phlyctochytrium arcticum]|nr:hypothetical protein DFS34DRAFT_619918 [Phlyctochytrium arcticum]